MNSWIFLLQIATLTSFLLLALRLGKEALTAFVAFSAVLANLFVMKQITLFGLSVTCSDGFAIGGLLGLNLLQEYFGKEAAKKAIRLCFFFMLFMAALSQIHLLFIPSMHDFAQPSYQLILGPSLRLLLASATAFFITQSFDYKLFAYLRKWGFAKATFISALCAQLIDTILFTFLGLYGLVQGLFDLILLSFMIKLLLICFYQPLVAWLKNQPFFQPKTDHDAF